MKSTEKYKLIEDFKIIIDDFGYGWESISLLFNGIPITFSASYIGQEPVSSLIEAVEALDEEYTSGSNESHYYIDWLSEPGLMNISLNHNLLDNHLTIEIKLSNNEDINNTVRQWHFVMSYYFFRQAVISLVVSSLNKYGICGFNHNWDAEYDILPLGSFLSILGGETYFDKDSKSFKSAFSKEIDLLTSILSPKN